MMFDKYWEQLIQLIQANRLNDMGRSFSYDELQTWPRAERQVILSPDTAIELGSPQTESASFLLWTDSKGKIQDERITIVGPELNEIDTLHAPLAKIILVKGHGFNEENAYQRYQEMDLLRFKMNLDGYMLRAVPQESKEWSRISRGALKDGFSLKLLGNELIRAYKKLEYVDTVEVVFITASKELVQQFKPLGQKIGRTIQAMNKMFDDLEFDCAHCNFADVCSELDGLKTMHQKAQNV